MDKENRAIDPSITPFDMQRLFVGSEPWPFYAEILFRTVVIYTYAFFLIRLIGKRATGQFSTIQIFLIVALGSAVGDPMFYAEVPLLHALAVITIVVGLNSAMTWMARKSETVDKLINLRPEQCVSEGVVMLSERSLTYEEVFGMLRLAGIENLGQVRSAYLEKTGSLSVFKFEEPRPGLTILPPSTARGDDDISRTEPVGDDVCAECGTIEPRSRKCSHCGACAWDTTEVFRRT